MDLRFAQKIYISLFIPVLFLVMFTMALRQFVGALLPHRPSFWAIWPKQYSEDKLRRTRYVASCYNYERQACMALYPAGL